MWKSLVSVTIWTLLIVHCDRCIRQAMRCRFQAHSNLIEVSSRRSHAGGRNHRAIRNIWYGSCCHLESSQKRRYRSMRSRRGFVSPNNSRDAITVSSPDWRMERHILTSLTDRCHYCCWMPGDRDAARAFVFSLDPMPRRSALVPRL